MSQVLDFDVCDCDCNRHGGTALHDFPCCELCHACGSDIKIGFRETHKSRCRALCNLTIQTEQETDGRWIAEAKDYNGALAYGESKEEALQKVKYLVCEILKAANPHRGIGRYQKTFKA